jgi:DNA primase
MDVRDAAQEIRDTVSMQDVLDLYGYRPQHGFIPCPFHGETNASLKVYSGGKGWHCFGCGRGGSVIDFVMEHDGCDFRTAVMAINGALGLDLMRHSNPLDIDRNRSLKRFIDGLTGIMIDQVNDRRKLTNAMLTYMTKKLMALESIPKEERTGRNWADLTILTEDMQYQEYILSRLDETEAMVRAWRTKKHRQLAREAL